MDTASFVDPAAHGYLRVAVAVPRVRVADPVFNADQTAQLHVQAAADGAALVLFPELGLSAYTCDDLFHQHALLDGCRAALLHVLDASRGNRCIAIVGLPLQLDHGLYNCAAVLQDGQLLAVIPKTFLPNYGEFYEARQFQPAASAMRSSVVIGAHEAPIGNDIVLVADDQPLFALHAEICEDLWVPVPPSCLAALAGATVLCNLSASNITIGKSAYRHALVSTQSARCLAAYLYSSAGDGESTTDLAWDGQSLICENGELLAESARFATDAHLISADIDLQRLAHERMRQGSFGQSVVQWGDAVRRFRRVGFRLASKSGSATLPEPPRGTDRAGPDRGAQGHGSVRGRLRRRLERFPYVPADTSRRDARCREVYDIQVQALAQRMSASGIKNLVIGVSGGLDSTQALLVAAQAMDRLGEPRGRILGVTMPGFATSTRTLDQAQRLMAVIGCEARQIDIRPSCQQMLADIDHPAARGERVYDITFENVQAGERTSHLFRLANLHGALVVGTGDLSELALGWCTYGVGDHMAHYNVNASVPKTLIRHLVRWVADSGRVGAAGSQVLLDVLDTEVSPELVPADEDEGASGSGPAQSTEASIGPYALHDFFLYYTLRYGYGPAKVAFLAWTAWHDADIGAWPDTRDVVRTQYALPDIRRHLRTFADRFFRTSQYKRSCVPNSPKVGSGGSLSPRGDWRAPSDGQAAVWLAEIDALPGDEPPV